MKTIVLIRHAKSSWEFDVEDRERPLKTRGSKDAELVSKHIKNKQLKPDKLFSSPANRALSTCRIFMKNLEIDQNLLKIENDLYDFGGQSVMRFIKSLDNNYRNVILFGHNHAFTSISNTMGSEFIENVPTCGVVQMEFDVDNWSDIQKGRTTYVLFPRDLK